MLKKIIAILVFLSASFSHSSFRQVSMEKTERFEILSESIRSVERDVQSQLQAHPSNVTKILLLGTTGSGKTTLLHMLAGRDLKVFEADGLVVLNADKPMKGFSIGHTADAETKNPRLWYDDARSVIYCDCPGFLDTRGAEQEIINSFAIDQLLSAPTKIKILLVVSEAEIEAGRGDIAKRQLQKLSNIIPEPEQLKRGIGLVVTKISGIRTGYQCISGFKGSSFGEEDSLFNFFLENPDTIFSIPKPSHDMVGTKYSMFDIGRLNEFLVNSPVENPHHTIVLDNGAFPLIVEVVKSFGDLRDIASQFVDRLSDEYRKENGIPALRVYENAINELIFAKKTSPKDFISSVHRFIPESERFDDILRQVERFQPWQVFIDRILDSGFGKKKEIIKSQSIFQSIYVDIAAEIEGPLNNCKIEINILIGKIEEHERMLNEIIEGLSIEGDRLKRQFEGENERLLRELENNSVVKEKLEADLGKLRKRIDSERKRAERDFQKKISEQNDIAEQEIKKLQDSFLKERLEQQNELRRLRRKLDEESSAHTRIYDATRARNEYEKKVEEIREAVCYDCRYKVDKIIKGKEEDCTIL